MYLIIIGIILLSMIIGIYLSYVIALKRAKNKIFFKEEKRKTIVIAGFPAIGKSYVFNKQKELGITCKDSDSSKYSKNETWEKEYIKDLKNNIKKGEYDYIFISTHEKVIQELINQGITFFAVYPCKSLKDEWKDKLLKRANDRVTEIVSAKYNDFVSDLENKGSKYKIDIRITSIHTNLYDIIKLWERR